MPRLTDEEKAERRKGIGSSDMGAIHSLTGRFSEPFDVWLDKTGKADIETIETEQMALGHELEPFMAAWYQKETGRQLLSGGQVWSPQGLVFATLDRKIVGEREGLEIKIALNSASLYHDHDEGIPDSVRAQVQTAMHAADLDSFHVAVLSPYFGRKIYTVKRDQELIDLLVSGATDFWNEFVIPKKRPELTGDRAVYDYLRSLYPRDTRELEPAREDEIDLMNHRAAAARQEKLGKEAKEKFDNQLREMIGDRAGIYIKGGHKVTWKDSGVGRKYRFGAKGEVVEV